MTLTEMRRFAEIARDEGVPLEMNPADVLALLDEVARLRAKVGTLKGQLDYCLETVGDAVRAAAPKGWQS